MANQIQEIEIRNLWGKFNYKWELNPDVNILAGLNGSGKSSVLQIIDAVFASEPERLKEFGVNGVIKGSDFTFSFNQGNPIEGWKKRNFIDISHFDIPLENRKYIKDNASLLDVELDSLIFTHLPGRDSFHNQHIEAKNSPQSSERFEQRIKGLFETINHLFDRSGKKLLIDPTTDTISILRGKDQLLFSQLSSGEKQLLIILFQVFLLNEQPSILLLDEPENSLHIEWQHQLIDVIRKLNPNSQLIISTHSPSIFGDGWGDKLFFLEDMTLD
jgi:predicted ATP-dependent endonuclease of OLD family